MDVEFNKDRLIEKLLEKVIYLEAKSDFLHAAVSAIYIQQGRNDFEELL